MKCNDDKHHLARAADELMCEVISPGKLQAIADGAFGPNLHQDVRQVVGGPSDGQLAIGVGTNKSKRKKAVMLAHAVAALLHREAVQPTSESVNVPRADSNRAREATGCILDKLLQRRVLWDISTKKKLLSMKWRGLASWARTRNVAKLLKH